MTEFPFSSFIFAIDGKQLGGGGGGGGGGARVVVVVVVGT